MQPDQDLLRYQRYLPLMGAGIEQALGDGVVTALVCVSDDLALFCLDFLAALGREVPSDISVVGFDDTLEATRRRLTSYDFNNNAVVRACVDHILNPRARLHTGHAPLDLDGYVVKRASSGPARGAGG